MIEHASYDCINAYFNERFMQKLSDEDKALELKRFEEIKERNKFVEGGEYSLHAEECDGFTMPTKTYKLVKVLNKVCGIDMDSLIMKQVGGESSSVFTLTKGDCKDLGIEFETGLQLFPKTMSWIESKQNEKPKLEMFTEPKFNSRDLSTYPLDFETKTIKNIIARISGFSFDGRMLRTPQGNVTSVDKFLQTLMVYSRNTLMTPIGPKTGGVKLPCRVVTELVTGKRGCLVDQNGAIYVEVHIEEGIIPNELENKEFYEVFNVGWESVRPITLQSNLNHFVLTAY